MTFIVIKLAVSFDQKLDIYSVWYYNDDVTLPIVFVEQELIHFLGSNKSVIANFLLTNGQLYCSDNCTPTKSAHYNWAPAWAITDLFLPRK